VWGGICQWRDYRRMGIAELIELHRSLNLKNYLEHEEYKMTENQK